MKKNRVWYLGFIGLFGLLGLVTGNVGLFGFFGFFGFFGLASQTDDEMLRHNLAKAGLNGFLVSLIGNLTAVVIISFVNSPEKISELFALSFALLFVVQILTFVISFNVYEKRGSLS